MRRKILIGLLAVLAVSGCNQKAWFEKLMPKEDVEFAKDYIALYQARDFESIEATIDPGLKNAELRPNLEQIAAIFPEGTPKDIQTVGFQSFRNADTCRVNLTLQYEYPEKWLLVNVVFQKNGSDITVMGMNTNPLRDSLQNINRFTWKGKGVRHFVIFGYAVIMPLFMLYALVLCIRTPIPKRKWLWVIFILLGFGQIALNWTDGNLNITPISFQILGAGFGKLSPYGPWLFSVSFPIGAVVFLLRRKKWLGQRNEG